MSNQQDADGEQVLPSTAGSHFGGPYKIDPDINPAARRNNDPQWLDSNENTWVTSMLIGTNVLVFAAMVLTTGGESLVKPSLSTLLGWGADFGPLTFSGEYWRVLTSTFVHGGIVHILMNMYVLWQTGPFVERLYGSSKFLMLYLLAGLCGSLCSLYFHPSTVSVGASGAVFGVYGALLAFFRIHAEHFPTEYLKSVTGTVVFFVIFNLVWGAAQQGIDNAAHIGGFIGGLLAGLALIPTTPRTRRWQLKDVLLTLVLLGALSLLAVFDYKAFLAH